MPNENRYYRGAGYHVDFYAAEEFAANFVNENGEVINTETDEFKAALNKFISAHARVEQAYVTPETNQLFVELNNKSWVV